jgi:hypothetical protein
MKKDKLTIEQLQDILNADEDVVMRILPNGEITVDADKSIKKVKGQKPLTMREDLGGEYGRFHEALVSVA